MTRILALLLSIILIESCERVEFEEETTGTSQSTLSLSTLKVFCQSYNIADRNDIKSAKLYAYAFDRESGKLNTFVPVALNSESTTTFQLGKGTYDIVATNIDASKDKSFSQDVILSINDNSLVNEKFVYFGRNDVYVDGKNDKSLNITLSPITNSLNVSVQGLPNEIRNATFSLYPALTSLNMKGEHNERDILSIPLMKQSGDTWRTHQTIRIIEEPTRNYTLNLYTELQDGSLVTYSSNLTGTFKAGENTEIDIQVLSDGTIKSTINSTTNEGSVNEDFDLGNADDDKLQDNDSQDVFMVDNLPYPATSWHNHIVAFVVNEDGQILKNEDINAFNINKFLDRTCSIILISRDEYKDVTATTYTGRNPNDALELTAKYKEDDLTNWRMPTRSEASLLRERYNDETALATLNETITGQNGTEIAVVDNDEYVRYLCEDAAYSFAFRKGSQISVAGKTLNNYRLRLLNVVKVRQKRK